MGKKHLQKRPKFVSLVCLHGFLPMGRLIETGNRAVSHVAASLRQALA